MKTTTFHFLVQAAREHFDLEEMGLNPDLTPLEYFVRTKTVPSKRMVSALLDVYRSKGLMVTLPDHGRPLKVEEAVRAMGDELGHSVPAPENRGKGRPPVSQSVDLMGLKRIIYEHGFTCRDLAIISGLYPTTISYHLGNVSKITPRKLEQILTGAQMLMAGNPRALKQLREMEKTL